MISYEAFVENFRLGDFSRLNFLYDNKEYLLVRDENLKTGRILFVYASEEETIKFETLDDMLSSVRFSSRPLSEIWKSCKLLPNDSLDDKDYVEILCGDALGNVLESHRGTVEMHDRYITQYFIPAFIICTLALITLVLCTVFIEALTWTIFGAAASVVVLAFVVSQIAYFGISTKFQRKNPRGTLYLMDDGAVILTDYTLFLLPYKQITRINAEPGLGIVNYKTVYSFTPNRSGNLVKFLQDKLAEIKARKRNILKKVFFHRSSTS